MNRSSEVKYTVTSSLHSLCAPAAGSAVSHIQYAGVPCNTSGGAAVLWTGMKTLDRNPSLPPRTVCAWAASAEPAAWATQFTGGCGTPPTQVHGLPTHFCTGPGSAPVPASNTLTAPLSPFPPPTPPAPAPALRALGWTMRGTVTSHKLNASGLDKWRILQLQSPRVIDWCPDGCGVGAAGYCTAICNGTLLAAAQVAGYDTAAFGADAADLTPLLFAMTPLALPPSPQPKRRNAGTARTGSATSSSARAAASPRVPVSILLSSTCLSNMVSGRYAPRDAWGALWGYIIAALLPPPAAQTSRGRFVMPQWPLPVHPSYTLAETLPTGAAAAAVVASAEWLVTGSTLLVDAAERGAANDSCTCCANNGHDQVCAMLKCSAAEVCPAPYLPVGVVNTTCIQEGWSSIIEYVGAQIDPTISRRRCCGGAVPTSSLRRHSMAFQQPSSLPASTAAPVGHTSRERVPRLYLPGSVFGS